MTTSTEALQVMNKFQSILMDHHGTIIKGKWRLTYVNMFPVATNGARLPIRVCLRFQHVSLTGFFETEAMGGGGIDAIYEWLEEIGVADGSVRFTINASAEEERQLQVA